MPLTTGAGNQPRFTFSEPRFEVLGFSGSEAMSGLFVFEVELVTRARSLDWDGLVGKPARLELTSADGTRRTVSGIIAELELVTNLPKRTICRARLVPPHYQLTLRRKLRVYQDLSVREIVTQVLADVGLTSLEWKLRDAPTARSYCAQHRETDLDFVARLLEEEGIGYHFEHGAELRTVFTDDNAALQAIDGAAEVSYNESTSLVPDQEHVSSFRLGQRRVSGKAQLRDYSFKQPRASLEGVATGTPAGLEVYDYPGEFALAGLGQRLAQVRLEELQRDERVGEGSGSSLRFLPGRRFTLGGSAGRHPRADLNQEYLLLQVSHAGRQEAVLGEEGTGELASYRNTFRVIPATVRFRPARVTPRPLALGVHSATVVGPPGEPIFVDEHGRVKLRFHWDRESKATSWVRVSQAWAGAGFGSVHLPRVGQEVLVSFLDGDPDRPLVTGRVYNGEQMVPYELPHYRTRSTIKSSSAPDQPAAPDATTGLVNVAQAGGGSNELRLEDAKGKEEVFVHAQRDYNVVVEHDRTTRVQRDRTEMVKHDQHLLVGNTLTVEVGAEARHTANKIVLEAKERLEVYVPTGGTVIELTPSSMRLVADKILASATQRHDLRGQPVKINTAPPVDLVKQLFEEPENWIDLLYQFNDGTGVGGAAYEVFSEDGKQLLAKGTLDSKGRASRVKLPAGHGQVRVRFAKDPKTYERFRQPKPHGLIPEGSPAAYAAALARLTDLPDK